MKRIIYLSLFLLLSINWVKAESPYLLDGIFTNPETYEEIIVQSNPAGIRIKGLSRKNPSKWIRFVRDGRNRFIDRNGNSLRISGSTHGHTAIIFNPRRGPNRIYQAGLLRHDRATCGTYIERPGHRNYGYDDYGYRQNDWDRRRGYNDFDNRDRYNNSFSMQGTYETRDGRSISILDTRTGFKAKFRGDRTWKSYERKGERFVDRDGNFYQISSHNKLIWNGKYSGKQIELTKQSDEVLF